MNFERHLNLVLGGLFSQDTLLETLDPYGDTVDLEDDTKEDNYVSGSEQVEAAELIKQLRARNELDQSEDNQLGLSLKRSQDAADLATAAYRKVNDLELKVDRGFGGLQKSLIKLSKGEPLEEPDPPGSSIFDEDEELSEFGFMFDDE